MKFWQAIAWVEPDQLIPIAKFAEEVGFEGVMSADHAVYPEQVKAIYPYSQDGKPPMDHNSPYPDCWVTIAAMAAATTRLKFSTAIYVLPLRNVFEVAKATGSLSLMSDNRFILGAGAGWMKDEFDIYGVPFERRGAIMEEMIDVMRKLWSGGMVEHRGEFLDFPRLEINPAPQTNVPVYLSGSSPIALKRAARCADGWIGPGNTVDEVATILEQFSRLRREAGREHKPFDTIIPLTEPAEPDTLRQLEEKGMTASVNFPFALSIGQKSSLDDKKRAMENFANAVIEPMSR